MKKYTIILFALVLVSFACCKKEANRQYSYWVVNNDSFSSNNVELAIGKGTIRLSCYDNENRFRIGFNFGFYKPTSGKFPLSHSSEQHPDSVGMSFYYKGNFYIIAPSNQSFLTASESNGKAKYTLSPGWFINYYDPGDSVLIHGVFNEP